jgi:hypothetical protein
VEDGLLPVAAPAPAAPPPQRTMEMFGDDFYGDEEMNQHFPTEELEPIKAETLVAKPVERDVGGPSRADSGLKPLPQSKPVPNQSRGASDPESEPDVWDPPTGEIFEITALPDFTIPTEEHSQRAPRSRHRMRLLVGLVGVAAFIAGALALARLF